MKKFAKRALALISLLTISANIVACGGNSGNNGPDYTVLLDNPGFWGELAKTTGGNDSEGGLGGDGSGDVVINGDPFTSYHSDKQTASILIDMKEERRISALGLFAPYVLRTNEKIGDHYKLTEAVESIPADVAIYTSKDGKVFEKQADAYCRIFADENIIRFAPTDARYVRFDVLSTVGRYSGKPKYADAKAAIGNLALFE